MKRPIKIYELDLVILNDDVKVDGFLKKRYKAHIARKTPRGKLIAIACQDYDVTSVRWSYFFNPYQLITLRVCRKCVDTLLPELKEDLDPVRKWLTPASNTGVN